jgi:hypothetical protein
MIPTLAMQSPTRTSRFGATLPQRKETPQFETTVSKLNENLFGNQLRFEFWQVGTHRKIGFMEILERTQKGIAEIQDIVIKVPRMGYATQVLQNYIDRCRERGFKKITLLDVSMDPITKTGSGIYHRAGFQSESGNFLSLTL